MPDTRSPFLIGMRAALGVLVIVMFAALAWQLRHLVMLSFLALLLGAALVTPASWLERRGWPRLAATLALYGGLVVVLGIVIFLVVPPLVDEAVAFAENLPALLEEGEAIATDWLGALLGAGAVERAFDIIGGADLMPEPGAVLQAPLLVAEVLINAVIVLVLSIFLLLERDRIREWLLRFFDREQRDPLRKLSANAATKLGAYVRGQLLIMVIVGVGATIGMLVLGVPFALPLGLLAFFAEAIPMAGPWIAGIPIVLVALLESPLTALLIGIWFTALQQVESYILAPIVHGHVVKLSPFVVMIAILAGATVAGVVGAIIAVPLAAMVDLVIDDVILPLRRGSEQVEPESEPA
ncbi:MAG TPA: AI-2E family transporter [Candidatus Limnocylindrales bacterium]|jgi:predicted PurR-regulated permease PerM|nr:AI-2E family transporter [Candidatus Limnocylindrales bacterium]